MAEAVKSLGFPVGDINNENFEGEGFWHTLPLSIGNGARRGTYRESITFKWTHSCQRNYAINFANICHIYVCTDDMQFK